MNILNQAGLVTMTLLLFGAHSWADTVSLPLTDDAFVLGVRPTANYGAWDDIFVTSYGPKHGLVRFDAASLRTPALSVSMPLRRHGMSPVLPGIINLLPKPLQQRSSIWPSPMRDR
jgi:hypothetical protein